MPRNRPPAASIFITLAFFVFPLALCTQSPSPVRLSRSGDGSVDHCRFLFLSPSVSQESLAGTGDNSHVFVSAAGRFASPSLSMPGPTSQLLLQPSRICEFAFIGSPDEKVDISFADFDFPGHPPQCQQAYLDIIFQSQTATFKNFVELRHENRFCGKDLANVPHRLISLYHSIFMLMDTIAMRNNTENWRGFRGTFAFIPAKPYHIGTPLVASSSGSSVATASSSRCGGQLVRSSMVSEGTILSPNYPGIYGDDMYCFWRLVGKPGERIKMTFNDFGLFYGDDQCSFDFVNVYDGFNTWSPTLRTMCGQHRDGDVTLFSRSNEMFIEFVSGRGRYDSRSYSGLPYWMPKDDYSNKRRGFKASFSFSSKIVALDNVLAPGGAHVAGTQCDQVIQSLRIGPAGITSTKKDAKSDLSVETKPADSVGMNTIYSPNYPDDSPENVSCTYIFQGRNERDFIEKVRISIVDFSLDFGEAELHDVSSSCGNEMVANTSSKASKTFSVSFQSGALLSALTTEVYSTYTRSFNTSDGKCHQSMVSGGRKTTLHSGMILESMGPNLTVVFSASSSELKQNKKRRFLLKYSFVRDFHVVDAGFGRQVNQKSCYFVFNSSQLLPSDPDSHVSALFTSPHFPRPYPGGLQCTYDFIIDRRHFSQLAVWFDLFDVGEPLDFRQRADRTIFCPGHDNLAVYQLRPAGSDADVTGGLVRTGAPLSVSPFSKPLLHSVLCGRYLPSPIVSDPESVGFQFVFTSHSEKIPGFPPEYQGFRANFRFKRRIEGDKANFSSKTPQQSTSMDCPAKQIIVGKKGVIVSPNYPHSFYPAKGLICDWTIQTYTKDSKLQLMLTEFELEGSYNPMVGLENCQNAAVEVYSGEELDQPSAIRCSSASILTGEIFLSKTSKARIRFLTSPMSTGGPGFRIDWNEVYNLNETACGKLPSKLWCASVGRCISAELKCDGIPHCGLFDLSDESDCTQRVESSHSLVLVGAVGLAALLSVLVILLVVTCKLRRRREKHEALDRETTTITPANTTPEERLSPSDANDNNSTLPPRPRVSIVTPKISISRTASSSLRTPVRYEVVGEEYQVRQQQRNRIRKSLEETILIDTETFGDPSRSSRQQGVRLFEKVTIV